MRTSFPVAAAIACFVFQANQGCQTTPAVSVTHLHGGKPETEQGDNLKIRRGAQEAYAGIHGGFYVVRSQEDWTALWPAGQVPPLPPTLDTTRQMLLVGMAESKDAVSVKMTRVYDSGPFIHVVVKETGAGANCKERPERLPFDAIVVDRVDKPVKFWVEDDAAQSCGDPPLAEVKCRVGESPTWSQAVSAGPGDTVDCEMTAQSSGRFEVIDRSLTMGQQPGGSSAKLSFTQGPTRGKFNVDLFGKYIVKGEAVDDGGRRGAATATVDVLPPKTKDVIVQLLWTNFDNNDDPETFPRTKLVAEEPATAKGQKPRICAADSAQPFCEVKTKSAYTLMKLKAGDKKLPLSVSYVDDTVEKGPRVCIQVYFDGARTTETCDRQHRGADTKWELGDLDLGTGMIVDHASEAADAGAPDAAAPKKK